MYGIDLGTSNSAVAEFVSGHPVPIKNAIGELITPSYLAFTKNGLLHGEVAKNQEVLFPKDTIYSTKRLIGRRYDEFEVQQQRKLAAYDIIDESNKPLVRLSNGEILSPTKIAGEFLSQLNYDGLIKEAVITVPAYFNNAQKQETENAAELSNIKCVRLLAEPTAAALAYDFSNGKKKNSENLMICDLGAGTYDVSILNKENGIYQVIATSGNNFFGGDDYTGYIYNEFSKEQSMEESKLLQLAEQCKIQLSTAQNFEFEGLKMSRLHYENLVEALDAELDKPIRDALADSNLEFSQIDKVLLVGGQTRQPSVVRHIAELSRQKPLKILDPDLCVAEGAAIEHAILKNQLNSLLLLDITPLSLGIETLGGQFSPLIARNSPIPTKQTQVYTTTEDNEETVRISIFEGERALAASNYKVGEILLRVKKQPKGVPRIEVTFEIDENGLLRVSGKDLETGIVEKIEINELKTEQAEQTEEEKIREKEVIQVEVLKRELAAEFGLAEQEMSNKSARELRVMKDRLGRRNK